MATKRNSQESCVFDYDCQRRRSHSASRIVYEQRDHASELWFGLPSGQVFEELSRTSQIVRVKRQPACDAFVRT